MTQTSIEQKTVLNILVLGYVGLQTNVQLIVKKKRINTTVWLQSPSGLPPSRPYFLLWRTQQKCLEADIGYLNILVVVFLFILAYIF